MNLYMLTAVDLISLTGELGPAWHRGNHVRYSHRYPTKPSYTFSNPHRPPTTCFRTQSDEEIFTMNDSEEYPPANAFNFSDPIDVAIYQSHYRAAYARDAVLADLCIAKSGGTIPFAGTTTVVRDMDRLFRAIEGDDAPINFWGFSYGSALGSYLVNMYEFFL